jgi:hypothetical protein
MKTFKGLRYDEIYALNSAVIGWEFEFYSNFDKKTTAKKLSELLGKKIVVCDYYHTDVDINDQVFKLEPDFSGGKDMLELVTGPLQYSEAKVIFTKFTEWLKVNGKTTNKCAIQPNISFNKFKIDLNNDISDIDILKFCLSVDEDFVYKRFPNRKNSVYTKSIKSIIPIHAFSFQSEVKNITRNNYILPREKYYGVNFSKLDKNYIEIRYMGGDNYHKKGREVMEIVDYFILLIWRMVQFGTYAEYDEADIKAMNTQLKKHSEMIKAIADYESFLLKFGDKLTITVDLKNNHQIIKSRYSDIRKMLFKLFTQSDIAEGEINYDSEYGRFQIRGADLGKVYHISNFDLIDCTFMGNVVDCSLYDCNITNATIDQCAIVSGNDIKDSKVINSTVSYGNVLTDCYIKIETLVFNGETVRGVIRSGIIGDNAIIDKDTEIIVNNVSNKKDKK